MAVTWRPPQLRLSIPEGRAFHRELAVAYDRDTGEPFDWTGWAARLTLVDEVGTEVVSFATSGEDGVITLTDDGKTDLDLSDDFTAALAATVSVAGVIHAVLYGDLDYIAPDATPYCGARVAAEITRSTST